MEQLINKVKKAAKDYNVKQIIIGGGVSANSYLRMRMKETFEKNMIWYCLHYGVQLIMLQ